MKIIDSILEVFDLFENKDITKIPFINIINGRDTLQKIKRRLSNQLLAIHIYDE